MPAPLRQAVRSRNTRDQIAQAALTVFALKGYAAASMDDVCLAAGCSKGGLYHHFRTKTAVLGAVIDRLASTGALLPPFGSAEGVTGLKGPALGRVLIEVWAEAARSEDLRTQLRDAYERRLDAQLTTATLALNDLLRIGVLIQLLTRGEQFDATAVARRLGIDQAA